jgi:ectoine hydroxylase-related dioxygenase (phytanoyl-CoA dioxygenase family)
MTQRTTSTETFTIRAGTVEPIPDPTSDSGLISLFPEALGQDGRPYMLLVEDPPHKTRPRHTHHGDVIYLYAAGEHHIEGEGTYIAGDIRWTRAGHTYGPETTGPEGGSWWVITNSDPIPIEKIVHDNEANDPTRSASHPMNEVTRIEEPHDWNQIRALTMSPGAVIVEGLFDEPTLLQFDSDIDALLSKMDTLQPNSGDPIYDVFLGKRTIRMHGLAAKSPTADHLISDPRLAQWATSLMAELCTSIMLNAAELIQIGPGEPAQFLHRDSDSWQAVPLGHAPIIVNAIVALDDFTLENGATHIALGSNAWAPGRSPNRDEVARAVMKRGDAILFRGDLIHGGGANTTETRRRALSLSYCAGWLRTVENHQLNVPQQKAQTLSETTQGLLGFRAHNGTSTRGGMLGLYEGGQPQNALRTNRDQK